MKSKLPICFLVCLSIAASFNSLAQGSWSQIAPFGGGAITEARAFSIGNFGYIGAATQDLWQYDPVTDAWTQMASMPGAARPSAAGFSIGTKGYFGTGGALNDFYEYDQVTNSWTQKTNFGGSAREGALGISISGKGYIGTGGNYLNDWWEYDPATDSWTQKANLAGPGRYHGGAFTIDTLGYVCTGFDGTFMNDLWAYSPVTNAWTAKASMPGTTRDRPVGISAGGKGYIVTGWTGTASLADAWEYDPVTDAWTSIAPFIGAARYNACGFGIGNKIYVGTGFPTSSDMYEYGPACVVLASAAATSCIGACDGTAGVSSPSGGATYQWSNGNTTAIINNLCAGTYTVTVTDSTGCTNSVSVTISDPGPITGTTVITPPSCFGLLDGQACFFPSGGTPPYTFQWALGDTSSCITNVPAGLYAVTVTDSTGCTGVNPVTITQPGQIGLNMNGMNASCSTCTNGSASVGVAGGTPPFSYQWSTGSTNAFINSLLPGVYSVCVTDSNSCSVCDSVVVSFSSGIGQVETPVVTVSPNPFSDVLQITLSNIFTSTTRLSILDVTGKRVMQQLISEKLTSLNTAHLPKGVYILEIESESTWYRLKLMK